MPRKPAVTVNPLFKLLVIVNTALCVSTLVGMVLLACFAGDPLSRAQERLLNACEHVFTMTAGAFIGLLGGRAAAPDSAAADPSQP